MNNKKYGLLIVLLAASWLNFFEDTDRSFQEPSALRVQARWFNPDLPAEALSLSPDSKTILASGSNYDLDRIDNWLIKQEALRYLILPDLVLLKSKAVLQFRYSPDSPVITRLAEPDFTEVKPFMILNKEIAELLQYLSV